MLYPGTARFRPSGLAVAPDGSLYIADSVQGRIWRVIPGQAADELRPAVIHRRIKLPQSLMRRFI